MGWTPTGGGGTGLTTKGDLHGYDTEDKRVPIGTNTHVLTADSAQALGLKWAAVDAASVPEWVSYLAARQGDETPHDDDDFFGSDSSADYTETDVTGSTAWSIGRGVLSCIFEDQSSNDFGIFTKAMTASGPPVTIETRMRVAMVAEDFITTGICFSDGTASGSKMITLNPINVDSGFRASVIALQSGTVTWVITSHGNLYSSVSINSFPMTIYLRLIWKSANTWQAAISIDGNAWTNRGFSNAAFTMTPTRIGFGVTEDGGAATLPQLVSYDYIRVYESDLSV